ncbi:MAG TPA: class I SAM-dependent methyltransferase [Kineosporiaceae bacterium]|nr:class I SAM-dependent methyltransferase [Kineosporiaceae bacterium]
MTSPGEPTGPPPRFEAAYAGTPPWDIGRPQPAFVALAETGAVAGRVLDVGCGTGEHTLMAAGIGLEAVGIDSAPSAIHRARRKAKDRNLATRFALGDALALDQLVTSPADTFDTVLDCGLFHVFTDQDRLRYVASLRAATGPGSRFHLLCFSDQVPGNTGPRRITAAEIVAAFAADWDIHEIRRDSIDITSGAQLPAWLASLVRR